MKRCVKCDLPETYETIEFDDKVYVIFVGVQSTKIRILIGARESNCWIN